MNFYDEVRCKYMYLEIFFKCVGGSVGAFWGFSMLGNEWNMQAMTVVIPNDFQNQVVCAR